MLTFSVKRLLPALLLLSTTFAAEKQIKLEDIEKDNLKSDHQAKLEKQYQEYQQYQQQSPLQYQDYQQAANYQQSPLNYQQAIAYQHPSVAYQPQQHQGANPYAQYVIPYNQQQYLQQAVYQGNYPQLGNNAIGSGYQGPAPAHPFQQYFSQQLQPVAVPSGQSGSPTHQQPIVMAYSSPSLAAFQQQAAAYYQGLGNLQQYVPNPSAGQNQQIPAFYYQPQPESSAAPHSASPSAAHQSTQLYYNPQQYVPPFQSISGARNQAPALSASASGPQYSPAASFQSAFPSPSPYTSSQTYNPSAESPYSFIKSSPQSSASLGQQKHYLQSIGSTVSPLQSKYLNSPQYLSQNYNTIPSTHLLPKSVYSGVKPTASPSLKAASQGGFVPNNPTSSSSGVNYQQYRSISG